MVMACCKETLHTSLASPREQNFRALFLGRGDMVKGKSCRLLVSDGSSFLFSSSFFVIFIRVSSHYVL